MIEQFMIGCLGGAAVYLSQDLRASWRRWACVLGLLGQPFWFYAAWRADQWGILLVCVFCAISWGKGFYNYWLKSR
jgi:hypothetical protein